MYNHSLKKESAAYSRKRREEYIDGLEKRVEKSAAANMKLEKKEKTLESENKLVLLFLFITVIITNNWICCYMVSNYSCLFKIMRYYICRV